MNEFIQYTGGAYPGSKLSNGLYQKIISIMPPHDVYIEPFAGSLSIMRKKIPARYNYASDLDPLIIDKFIYAGPPHFQLFTNDYKDFIDYVINKHTRERIIIYCDPPYLLDVDPDLYNYNMTAEDHIDLLKYLKYIQAYIIISCYDCHIYRELLKDWGKLSFNARTRGKNSTETIYFNYPLPRILHDFRYLGRDFTDRQRLKRKGERFISKLEGLPDLEKNYLLNVVYDNYLKMDFKDIVDLVDK